MKTYSKFIWYGLIPLLSASCTPQARTQNARVHDEQACKAFVQKFYDWYLQTAVPQGLRGGPPWDYVLKYKGQAFSTELRRRLKEDSATPADGDLMELDFDPILNSQDPGERQAVGAVTRKGGSYWADVYDIRDGKKSDTPIVMPELVLKDHRWIFVNFHYPTGGDLLSILKKNHEELKKGSK